MEDMRAQKTEALIIAKEYLDKLVPGMKTLCQELQGERKDDTDDFQKQCIDGLNWIIEIYNRTSDIINADAVHIDKEELNSKILKLSEALKNKNDLETANSLESDIIPFLTLLSDLIGDKVRL